MEVTRSGNIYTDITQRIKLTLPDTAIAAALHMNLQKLREGHVSTDFSIALDPGLLPKGANIENIKLQLGNALEEAGLLTYPHANYIRAASEKGLQDLFQKLDKALPGQSATLAEMRDGIESEMTSLRSADANIAAAKPTSEKRGK